MAIDFKSIADSLYPQKWTENELMLIKKAVADGCRALHAELLMPYFPHRTKEGIGKKLRMFSK